MRHVPFVVQYLYECNDEGGEDEDWKEGSEIPGRWERVKIT